MNYVNERSMSEVMDDLFNDIEQVEWTAEPLLHLVTNDYDRKLLYDSITILSTDALIHIIRAVRSTSFDRVILSTGEMKWAVENALTVVSKIPRERSGKAVKALLAVREDSERIYQLAEQGAWE